MRKLALALMILVASAAVAGKPDKIKTKKSKSFEPVVMTVSEYAGSYRGPDVTYGLVLESRGGRLSGTYVERGKVAVLHPIDVDGADFTATASFDDGSWREIHGTFVIRTFNGEKAFGVRMQGVKIDGMGDEVSTFFENLK
jgi:hypothetical protein